MLALKHYSPALPAPPGWVKAGISSPFAAWHKAFPAVQSTGIVLWGHGSSPSTGFHPGMPGTISSLRINSGLNSLSLPPAGTISLHTGLLGVGKRVSFFPAFFNVISFCYSKIGQYGLSSDLLGSCAGNLVHESLFNLVCLQEEDHQGRLFCHHFALPLRISLKESPCYVSYVLY